MKPQRDLPPEWSERMGALGFHYRGRPSARALADSAGVTVNAALRVIFRENYGQDTALALGRALRDPKFVAEWVSIPLGEDYSPPAVSRMLTPRQRVLVDDLIRELARTEVSSDAGNADAKNRLTTRDDVDLAAHTVPGHGKIREARQAMKRVGEESQDDGGWEPA